MRPSSIVVYSAFLESPKLASLFLDIQEECHVSSTDEVSDLSTFIVNVASAMLSLQLSIALLSRLVDQNAVTFEEYCDPSDGSLKQDPLRLSPKSLKATSRLEYLSS